MPSSASERIFICGAGIAGIAAAYYLSVEHGCNDVVIVEAADPLSMTSDKSTEAFRNWWPGPDGTMTAYMNRSIDLLSGIAGSTGNRINLMRRGYLFATADPAKLSWLREMAALASEHGAGPLRIHDQPDSDYRSELPAWSDDSLNGADFITDTGLIRRHFPYLNESTIAVAHARRAGSLSAQQLGMTMLEAARDNGVQLVRGKMVGVDATGNTLRSVLIDSDGQRQEMPADKLVLAAGPMIQEVASLVGVDLPVFAERHLKISFDDKHGSIARDAPMLIWLDAQRLPWTEEDKAVLGEDEATAWLLNEFPAGVHCRPDGRGATILGLYTYDEEAREVEFPLPEDPHYAEIVMRGLSTMLPDLSTYVNDGTRPYVDGGYYMRTRENRPLIGPLPVDGVYISAAYSGFGIMASCAGADLLARHIVGKPLPDYAPVFALSRYQDQAYLDILENWGDDGQL